MAATDAKPAKVLVCELVRSHYHLVRPIVKALLEKKVEVVLAVSEVGAEELYFQRQLKDLVDSPLVTLVRPFPTYPVSRYTYSDSAKEMYFKHCTKVIAKITLQFQPQTILIPSGDLLVEQLLKRKREEPFSKVNIVAGLHWPKSRILASMNRDIKRSDSEEKVSLLLQDGFAAEIFREKYAGQIDIGQTPVPVEHFAPVEKSEAREMLGLPVDGRIIGFAGSIQDRKGVRMFIRHFSTHLQPNDVILLFGPVEERLLQYLHKKRGDLIDRGQLVIRNDRHNHYDLHIAISAMDMLVPRWVGLNHSSDICLRSLVAGRPMIAGTGAWGEALRDRYGSIEIVDHRHLSDAQSGRIIHEALAEAAGYQPRASLQEFVDFHTSENYAKIWTGKTAELTAGMA